MPEKNLYLDDLYVGQTFVSGEHLLDEAQIIAYARQFDPQVFHLDPEAAKRTFFQAEQPDQERRPVPGKKFHR